MNIFDVNEYVCVPSETKLAYINKKFYNESCSFRMFPTAQADLIIEQRKSTPYEFFVDKMDRDAIDWCDENEIEFFIEKVKCYKSRFSWQSLFEILIFNSEEDAMAFKLRWM